jgi:trehalose-6-phosphate synthase
LKKADLVGFQTYDYARHFLSACSRVLEVEATPKGVEYDNHYCAIGVYPIGVDADHITTLCRSQPVLSRVKELERKFAGRKILLGVDRLDYIKGMPHKLLGLELFLNHHPEWRGKVTLIQIGVPTREDVDEYQKLGQQVNELVSLWCVCVVEGREREKERGKDRENWCTLKSVHNPHAGSV